MQIIFYLLSQPQYIMRERKIDIYLEHFMGNAISKLETKQLYLDALAAAEPSAVVKTYFDTQYAGWDTVDINDKRKKGQSFIDKLSRTAFVSSGWIGAAAFLFGAGTLLDVTGVGIFGVPIQLGAIFIGLGGPGVAIKDNFVTRPREIKNAYKVYNDFILPIADGQTIALNSENPLSQEQWKKAHALLLGKAQEFELSNLADTVFNTYLIVSGQKDAIAEEAENDDTRDFAARYSAGLDVARRAFDKRVSDAISIGRPLSLAA